MLLNKREITETLLQMILAMTNTVHSFQVWHRYYVYSADQATRLDINNNTYYVTYPHQSQDNPVMLTSTGPYPRSTPRIDSQHRGTEPPEQ